MLFRDKRGRLRNDSRMRWDEVPSYNVNKRPAERTMEAFDEDVMVTRHIGRVFRSAEECYLFDPTYLRICHPKRKHP